MVRKFEDAIKISTNKYASATGLMRKEIGNQAVSHFKDSFRNQGFDDSHVTPWKQRKVQGRNKKGRAILVKTGRLRRSFVISYSTEKITIINDTPYSTYHNYGSKNLPQRRFMGQSRDLNKKIQATIVRVLKRSL